MLTCFKCVKGIEMEQVIEKRCSKCGEVKPFSEFSRQSRNKDGYEGRCKDCIKSYMSNWRDDNRDRVNQYFVDWRRRNPLVSAEISSRYKARDPIKTKSRYTKFNKLRCDYFSDSYVRDKLKLSVKDCPPELIKLKRIHLQITRELRSKK